MYFTQNNNYTLVLVIIESLPFDFCSSSTSELKFEEIVVPDDERYLNPSLHIY
jgi:hypothetical protein